MRGLTRLPASTGSSLSDERGATLALVALLLVAMLGLVALVVDLGRMQLVRQALVPAADAAALAAAQDLANRPWDVTGACATASAYVAANAPASSLVDCSVGQTGAGGWVTVATAQDLETSFAVPAEGAEVTGASSTAAWGAPSSVTGLRPIGFCHDGLYALENLIEQPPSGVTYIQVPFVPDNPLACGGWSGAGTFASLDFEQGSDLALIKSWLTGGYPEAVDFGQPGSSQCDVGQFCNPRSFPLPDLAGALSSLVASADYVPFPIFDHETPERVHVVGVLRARVYDFHLGGDPQYWRIDLKFDPGLVVGTCCGTPGLVAGNRVVAICGVDGTNGALCQEPTS